MTLSVQVLPLPYFLFLRRSSSSRCIGDDSAPKQRITVSLVAKEKECLDNFEASEARLNYYGRKIFAPTRILIFKV